MQENKEIQFMEDNEDYIFELYEIIKEKHYYFLDNMQFHKFIHFIVDNKFGNYIPLKYTRNTMYFHEEYDTEINNTFRYLYPFNITLDNWVEFCYRESFN